MDRDDKAKQLIMDMQGTFGTEEGKRVLAKLVSLTTYGKSGIKSDGPIDTNRLIYDEGQRAVVLYILNMLAKDPHKEKQLKAQESDNG